MFWSFHPLVDKTNNEYFNTESGETIFQGHTKIAQRNESLALCKGMLDSVGFWPVPHQVVDSGFFGSGTCMIRIPIVSGIRMIVRAVYSGFKVQDSGYHKRNKSLNSGYPNSEITPLDSSYDTKVFPF